MGTKGGKAKRVIEKPILYTITDKAFGELQIKNSPNAWWIEKGKVENLITACKIDATVEECCAYAGITGNQYQYFTEQHPDFSRIKATLNQYPFLKARKKIIDGLDETFQNAMEYMKRKKKLEFSERQEMTGAEGKDLPTPILQINVLRNDSDKENKEPNKAN